MLMDKYISSPSRLNRKLEYHSALLSQRNPNYYAYISNKVDSSCLDTETRLRELTYATSPKRNYAQYPLRSNLGSAKSYPVNRSNNALIAQSITEKQSIIDQFCDVSQMAMDRIARLDDFNDSLLKKIQGYEVKEPINRQREVIEKDRPDDNKCLLNTLCKSVERLEQGQDDWRKQFDSVYRRDRDSSYKISGMNVFNRSEQGYFCQRTKEEEIARTRDEVEEKIRDYSKAEWQYDSKISDLKLKISFFEKELDRFKHTQLNYLNPSFLNGDSKYLVN